MKIGYDRQDALVGAGYAVSAHLAEGKVCELMRDPFFSGRTRVLICRAISDAEPHLQGIASVLRAGGYTVSAGDGTPENLRARLAETGDDSILLTYGDLHAMATDADVPVEFDSPIPHLWWVSRPCDAFCLPPEGLPAPLLTLVDPTLYAPEDLTAALPYALRPGILFDKHLFSLVYSSFDPVTLFTRGCRLMQDLAREDAGNVRARLAFGTMMAEVIHHLAGGELTDAEALALGMLYEVRLGAKLGVSNPRKLADLEGVLAYHGFPRAIAASGEELSSAFTTLFGAQETQTLTLPVAIGKCRTAEYATETIARLLLSLGD